jgi:hypothetical protein
MCPYIATASSNNHHKLLFLTDMDHPLRHFSTRIPSIPGHPLYCPKCLATTRFYNDEERDLHYLQHHVLDFSKVKVPKGLTMIDSENYDGPLGKKQHYFPARKYCEEPESYSTEEEKSLDEQNVRRSQGEQEVHTEHAVAREDIKS